MGLRASALGVVASLLFACAQRGEKTTPVEAEPLRDPARAAALASVRDVDSVTSEDLGHGDGAVRRAAVRALARIDDPRVVTQLLPTLSDEDPEAIAFSAHGLGWACEQDPSRAASTTKALIARAISLEPEGTPAFDPAFAITRALVRCASAPTEPTLVAYLHRSAPWARGAALALGILASEKGALAKATQLALVEAAAAPRSIDEALFALARIDVASDLHPRLVEVARSRLDQKGPARFFGLRALGRAGAEGARLLADAVKEADLDEAERAEALRALARLGENGQRALRDYVKTAMPSEGEVEALQGVTFGPLLVAVEGLGTTWTWARETLQAVARTPVPTDASPALARRLDRLRCTAGKRVVATGDPLLEGCEAPRLAGETRQASAVNAQAPEPASQPRKLRFVTDAGSATVTLDPSLAPRSVARIVELAKGGYFDGTPIGRAIPGFFVRLGGGKEGASRPAPLPRETSPIPFDAFTVGLALDDDGTASDELFVTLARLPELDGRYAWLGRADRAFAQLAEGDVIEKVVVED